MSRLIVNVEGQTEETFVNEILNSHLYHLGYHAVSARLLGNSRVRGGIQPWPSVRRDLLGQLKSDPTCIITTMVDYYGLPQSEGRAWPGRVDAPTQPSDQRAQFVEAAIFDDIAQDMEPDFIGERFVPFVLMHEFESLLFSDCDAFARGIARSDLAEKFQEIRDLFGSPEEINDSPATAPSKRILSLMPAYQKPLMGTLGVLEIGFDAIRAECPRFAAWLARLETLAPGA